jgi:hypothetical protein
MAKQPAPKEKKKAASKGGTKFGGKQAPAFGSKDEKEKK